MSWVLYTKIFPNFNVVHLVVPVGWGSCLPRLAIFNLCSKYLNSDESFQI